MYVHHTFIGKLSPVEREWLATHTEVRLGIGESWTPFVFKKTDGTLEGYDVDS